ncbi:type I secretion system permease/ATPase [Enterovirga aerilata]|uniref:Type I secretion system permease/ATPase n=1 Tax=Enterovirga aerilata TaxID=2730920 RepID=A0A849I891_9HYPH|nr:type I secretion system permease/ATPase [Enterovirga sp. DB1703]NNM73541.1 type I secretion system permease/ATPase [Enterovirga sp. DB1703]
MTQKTGRGPSHEISLAEILRPCRNVIVAVAAVSGLINLLMLTGPLFMLQVYDRVLPSRSVPTLVALGLIALVLYAIQAALEILRSRTLGRVARVVDERLAARLFRKVVEASAEKREPSSSLQALRDLDTCRSFLSGGGTVAIFDLPWMPLYLAVCFAFHPLIGIAVLLGALLLAAVTVTTDKLSRGPAEAMVAAAATRQVTADAVCRNAELVHALGMRHRTTRLWGRDNQAYLDRSEAGGDVAGAAAGLSRFLRTALQSGILALGAFLVIKGEATPGVMLAATIICSRALAPLDQVIANWRSFVSARQGWSRLRDWFANPPATQDPTPLPVPSRSLRLASVSLAPPGTDTLIVHNVSFAIEAGSALGVIWPSGSGKSSLARALVGLWRPARGVVRLDGATLDQWEPDALGSFIGYMPQDVELLRGTVAQNIARFADHPDHGALIAAAQVAGVHEVILRLPNGYDTPVGESGARLSGGQKQRIGLARALYGEPFLVVLDEPNSNLDAEGERALTAAIHSVRARGGIAVVIAHRPSALAAVDKILVLNEGQVQAFGPREEILPRLLGPARPATVPAPAEPSPAARSA